MSAGLMRRILVGFARSKGYQKLGRGGQKITLDDVFLVGAEVDPRKSQVVELRFLGGLTVEETVDETAEVLEVSRDTVMRDWSLAKVWLMRELRRDRTR
jgi:DNA-directed RNA polymerase specialized sigma24 family protein